MTTVREGAIFGDFCLLLVLTTTAWSKSMPEMDNDITD